MTAEKDALARAFVSDPGWRWMDGMNMRVGNSHHRLSKRDLWMADRPDALPDLDDPATLGCIEHGLLPERWPGCHIQTHVTPCGVMSIYVHDAEVAELFAIEEVPKAEALLAALRASAVREVQP